MIVRAGRPSLRGNNTTRYGYDLSQIRLRFYVGRFAGPTKGEDEKRIRAWCSEQIVGGGPI
jgi:hypothetical protein